MENRQKFSSQARPEILADFRDLAASEGRQFQSALEEAMQDYIEKKRNGKVRPSVQQAFDQSMQSFDSLYQKLAK